MGNYFDILNYRVTGELNLEHKMALVVQWYLGCIRACQLEMTAARKPFNPMHGEIFKCIWNMKDGIYLNFSGLKMILYGFRLSRGNWRNSGLSLFGGTSLPQSSSHRFLL